MSEAESIFRDMAERNERAHHLHTLLAEYDRREAVAESARALLRTNGDDPEWASLRVALYELDGDDR